MLKKLVLSLVEGPTSFVLASFKGSTYLTVRFAFSFAAAALDRRFEHPYLRKAHSLLFVPQGFGRGGQPTKFRHTREGGYPFSKTSRWIPD
jgi:hypothetical protein